MAWYGYPNDHLVDIVYGEVSHNIVGFRVCFPTSRP